MPLFLSTLLLFRCISLTNQTVDNVSIRFDGIYETLCVQEEEYIEGEQYHLRFYKNGQVISVSTDCEWPIDEFKAWFNLRSEKVSIGEYRLTDKILTFSFKYNDGGVLYKGKILSKNVLELEVLSLINGYKSIERYHFVPEPAQ